jgi:hypothetical protein
VLNLPYRGRDMRGEVNGPGRSVRLTVRASARPEWDFPSDPGAARAPPPGLASARLNRLASVLKLGEFNRGGR